MAALHTYNILDTQPEQGFDHVVELALAALIHRRWPPVELTIISATPGSRSEDISARGIFFSNPYVEQDMVAALHWMTA